MNINILYPFKEGPWGGANQFLKAIRNYLKAQGNYEDNRIDADIVLFNASPSGELIVLIDELYALKKQNSALLVFIRIDGPIYLIRDMDFEIDSAFYQLCNVLADGVIYQSDWSKEKNKDQGMKNNCHEAVIINAPNSDIFNTLTRVSFDNNKKIRLISTSWSNNWKKGFSVYQWLDKNLDFTKYEMVFIGNSPVTFDNIIHIPPLDSKALADELKRSDIFITASQNDPCSNSLIEALHCGLPSIVLKDGGHPEIVGKGGEVFTEANEIPVLITKIVKNYSIYQNNIKMPTMDMTGRMYADFMNDVASLVTKGVYIPKKFKWIRYIKIKMMIIIWLFKQKYLGLRRKMSLK